MEAMTSKERWLAALQMQAVDRLPFWPKIDKSYTIARDGSYREWTVDNFHEWFGSDPLVGLPTFIQETCKSGTKHVQVQGDVRTTTIATKRGAVRSVEKFDYPSQAWAFLEYPLKTVDDIPPLIEWYANLEISSDPQSLAEAKSRHKAIGNRAVTAIAIGKSPLMSFVELLAGVETAHYALIDRPDLVQELFMHMHRALLTKTEILSDQSPSDFIWLIENTSTSLISPQQYRQYNLPHLRQYTGTANNKGRMMVLHMCGLLKHLLPDLSTLPVRGFEAFTPPPVGNVTLAEGREACPDTCLIGGTDAFLWTRSETEIIDQLETWLNQLPHHRGLVITSSGVMPPRCLPETIERVGRWLRSLPVRM